MEDLQDIIDNISDKQGPVSTSLKAVISKLKKRNKLIKIVDSTEGGWAVVAEYEKEPIGSNSDDCKRTRQAETRASKKKYRKSEIRTVSLPIQVQFVSPTSKFQLTLETLA